MENDDNDIRKKYMVNFKPHQPRIGKDYQAVIPDCHPRNKNDKKKEDKTLSQLNSQHKAHFEIENEKREEYIPVKKRKLEENQKKNKEEIN